ncbi:MAG: hypothetical protein ACOH2H_12715 [Cypionkella sp.]
MAENKRNQALVSTAIDSKFLGCVFGGLRVRDVIAAGRVEGRASSTER